MEYLDDNSMVEAIMSLDKQMSGCEFVRIFNDYKPQRNLYLKELNEQQVNKLKITRQEFFLNNYNSKSHDFKFDLISPEDLISNYETELLVYLNNNKSKIEKSVLCDFLFLEALANNKLKIIDFYLVNKNNVLNSEENINEMAKRIKNGNEMLSLSLINKKDIWEKISFNNKQKLLQSIILLEDNTEAVKSLFDKKEELPKDILYKIFYNACLNGNEETVFIIYNHDKQLLNMDSEPLWKLYETILANNKSLDVFFKIVEEKYRNLDIFYGKNSLLSLAIRKQNVQALNILLVKGANPLLAGQKCKNAINTLSLIISKNGITPKIAEMQILINKHILNKQIETDVIPIIVKLPRI